MWEQLVMEKEYVGIIQRWRRQICTEIRLYSAPRSKICTFTCPGILYFQYSRYSCYHLLWKKTQIDKADCEFHSLNESEGFCLNNNYYRCYLVLYILYIFIYMIYIWIYMIWYMIWYIWIYMIWYIWYYIYEYIYMTWYIYICHSGCIFLGRGKIKKQSFG